VTVLEVTAAVVLAFCAGAALVACFRGLEGIGDELLRREDPGTVSEGTRQRYQGGGTEV